LAPIDGYEEWRVGQVNTGSAVTGITSEQGVSIIGDLAHYANALPQLVLARLRQPPNPRVAVGYEVDARLRGLRIEQLKVAERSLLRETIACVS
jgi:hypothetical protein